MSGIDNNKSGEHQPLWCYSDALINSADFICNNCLKVKSSLYLSVFETKQKNVHIRKNKICTYAKFLKKSRFFGIFFATGLWGTRAMRRRQFYSANGFVSKIERQMFFSIGGHRMSKTLKQIGKQSSKKRPDLKGDQAVKMQKFGGEKISSTDIANICLSLEVAVISGIHTSAVLLNNDFTCGLAAMADDIISSTSSNFADNLSNSDASSS
ncbi:hypothetical protein LXL04_010442 [Taraxacum kok-saghyz]